MRTLDDLKGKWTWVRDSCGGGLITTGDFFFQGIEEEAMEYVEDVLGHDPYSMNCECCGNDLGFDEGDIVKMAALELREQGETCEWDKWSMKIRYDGPILTYETAQQRVLAYMNGKESELTSIEFVFKGVSK